MVLEVLVQGWEGTITLGLWWGLYGNSRKHTVEQTEEEEAGVSAYFKGMPPLNQEPPIRFYLLEVLSSPTSTMLGSKSRD